MQHLQDHGETHSAELSGSHQEREDEAGFFDVKTDFKLPLDWFQNLVSTIPRTTSNCLMDQYRNLVSMM
eukprot:12918711-Prorocentrum_lima.AAC.1